MIGQVALTEQTTSHPDKTRYFLGEAEIDGNPSKWQFFARESLKRDYKTGGGVGQEHMLYRQNGERREKGFSFATLLFYVHLIYFMFIVMYTTWKPIC